MRSCLCARSTLEVFINDIVGLSLGKKAHRTALINRTPSQRPTLQKRAIHGYQRSYTTQAVQETAANLDSIVETGNNIPSHTSLPKEKHTSLVSSRSVVKDSERQDARLARKNRRIANGLFRAASKVQAGISKWKTHSNETEGKSTSKRSSPRRARSRALTQKGSPRNSPLSTKSTPAEEENVEDVVVRNILSNALEPKVRLSKRSRDSSTDEKDEQETTPPTPVTQTPDTEETEQYERPYWQIQKAALKEKFGDEGWKPRKRLSPDSLNGIRALHQSAPDIYTTPVLSQHFKITPEAIRRILKSKWMPREDEIEDRRKRWERRGVLHRADIRASSQRSKNARELKAIFNPVIDPETLELKPLEKTKRTG